MGVAVMNRRGYLLAVIATLAFVASADAAAMYNITDLGPGEAVSINNFDQVVGTWGTPRRAVLWENGTITEFGANSTGGTYANTINDLGQAVGASFGPEQPQPFMWQDGVLSDLSAAVGSRSYVTGINDAGRIVGYSGGPSQAYVLADGVKTDLGDLGGSFSWASDISNTGQAVGRSTVHDGKYHPFLWSAITGMVDLGFWGSGSGINDLGQVVGSLYPGGGVSEPFFWDDTSGLHPLGTLGGASGGARAVNNNGQVVGSSRISTGSDATRHGFLWEGGTLYDLNNLLVGTPGWELWSANDINDSGQIVGMGLLNGQEHAFLLTPIPEPATVSFLALGALAAARRRRLC